MYALAGGIGPLLLDFAESIPNFHSNITGWNDDGETPCTGWQGIDCNHDNLTQAVTAINLSSLELSGW